VRSFVKEPDRWQSSAAEAAPKISELFQPEYRKIMFSGLSMALTALIMWWSCNAFIPTIASGLAAVQAKAQGLEKAASQQLIEEWKRLATNCFNIGGLIGTLLTVPFAKNFGRRVMFGVYFVLSALALFGTFGLDLEPHTRLYGYFFIGLTVFGVFGSFTYYLPELFPTRLRATGAGFCYNSGRFIAAGGPFLVGAIAARGTDALASALNVLFWVGIVPAIGALATPFFVDTRHSALKA
jgi:MFS family permease